MITFLNCYLIIGVIIASLIILTINTIGIDYLLKDIEPKIDIDFNKFSTQLIFVLIIIVLWPIIFLSKND
jgi:hypothetical protein